ncbi:MAG: ATP-dependent Zn protease [Mariniblastus sp.]
MEEIETLTAYHESGHAVISVLMGGQVDEVSISPPDDDGPNRYGHTITRWPAMTREKLIAAEICVSLAGPVAEMLYVDEIRLISDVPEWAADWFRASQIAVDELATLGLAERLLVDCQNRIERLFDQQNAWAAVGAVADELLAHETLEREQVDDVVSFWLRR